MWHASELSRAEVDDQAKLISNNKYKQAIGTQF